VPEHTVAWIDYENSTDGTEIWRVSNDPYKLLYIEDAGMCQIFICLFFFFFFSPFSHTGFCSGIHQVCPAVVLLHDWRFLWCHSQYDACHWPEVTVTYLLRSSTILWPVSSLIQPAHGNLGPISGRLQNEWDLRFWIRPELADLEGRQAPKPVWGLWCVSPPPSPSPLKVPQSSIIPSFVMILT